MNVVFDSMGTLFRLTPLEERLGKAATEAWFERILHTGLALIPDETPGTWATSLVDAVAQAQAKAEP